MEVVLDGHGAERPPRERAVLRRYPDLPGVESLDATYVGHAFAPHAHDALAIGVIERGWGGFRHGSLAHVAPTGTIVVINPGDVHTGYATGAATLAYRMLYVAPDLLARAAEGVAPWPPTSPAFRHPVLHDPLLCGRLRALHVGLEQPASRIERESLLLTALGRLVERHGEGPRSALPSAPAHRGVERAREYILAHPDRDLSLARLADVAGLSPWHLVRVFHAAVGLPPHAYLDQVRVGQAKRLLADGWPIARAAHEVGFADQSHLTRRFKRIVGVTPGRYVAEDKNVQDRRSPRR